MIGASVAGDVTVRTSSNGRVHRPLRTGARLISGAMAAMWMLFVPVAVRGQTRYETLRDLSATFWRWRAVTQPSTSDDIPRIERPVGWVPDWSPAAVRNRQVRLVRLEARWEAIDTTGWSIPHQVDYRLMGSALARARWELVVNPAWRRDPFFYIDQTLGSVFELLLQPPPFDPARSTDIIRRLDRIPATLAAARENLDRPVRPFARLARDEAAAAPERLRTVAERLGPHLSGPDAGRLNSTTDAAGRALAAFADWLDDGLDSMPEETAVGGGPYRFFLHRVALLPFEPEELVKMARQEWERAVAFETLELHRNRGLDTLGYFPDQAAQIGRERQDEDAIRRFLETRDLLTVPDWLHHYTNRPVPDYLVPLAHLGVDDDLTSPTRLDQDAVSYIWPPSPALGYFARSTARDPRPIIVHEGVPGHYFQLALSWAQDNPIRRHYYDSGANEGIGFYAEEMMLQAGLWDQSPRSREIIYNFMRLRALRVEVDVRLATGEFTIDEAADYLERTVPMDRATAREEAAFFASTPGQAISYQIGKLQIVHLVAEARRRRGDRFSLRHLHDFLWRNGNVPIALVSWEYLESGEDGDPGNR